MIRWGYGGYVLHLTARVPKVGGLEYKHLGTEYKNRGLQSNKEKNGKQNQVNRQPKT